MTGAPYLDFVSVHGCVCNHDLGVLDALRLSDTNLLVHQEALLEVRVAHGASWLLDDLDELQVEGALDASDGIHSKRREPVALVCEQLGGERGARNLHEAVLELVSVSGVVLSACLELGESNLAGIAVAWHSGPPASERVG